MCIYMAYSKVHIVNSTNFSVKGKVKYASAFCADDNYEIAPWGSWTAGSRGVCLLTEVSATVHTPVSYTHLLDWCNPHPVSPSSR